MSSIRDINMHIKKYYKTDAKLAGKEQEEVLERITNISEILNDEVKRQDALLDQERAGSNKKVVHKEKEKKKSTGPKMFDEKDIDRDLHALTANSDKFSFP